MADSLRDTRGDAAIALQRASQIACKKSAHEQDLEKL
jgi:hypothetical protein